MGGWVGRSTMADATKTTARLTGHMTYTQAPAVCEKNISHLFRFTQPVENYPRLIFIFVVKIVSTCIYMYIYKNWNKSLVVFTQQEHHTKESPLLSSHEGTCYRDTMTSCVVGLFFMLQHWRTIMFLFNISLHLFLLFRP